MAAPSEGLPAVSISDTDASRARALAPPGERRLDDGLSALTASPLIADLQDYAIFMLDPEGLVATWNAGAQRIKGYLPEEIVGRHFSAFYTSEDVAAGKPQRHLEIAAAEGRLEDEGWRVRKDGARFWADVVISAVRDPDGTLRGFGKLTRDLTERRRAEESMRASEMRFRGLLESAPDAMVIADADGSIVLVNAQTEMMFGYQRDELLGRRIEMLLPDRFREHRPGARRAYPAAPHARSVSAGLELDGRHKDGSEFPVEISLSPLESEDGTLISSAIRDITDRRRREREASFFTAVVESSRDAIIGTDLDGVITSWNPGAERLYGYSAPEICGRSVLILVPPGQGDDLPEILRRARDHVDDIETVRVRKDGTQVDVALTVSQILDRDGTVIGASTIARDIGVRLRYQQQLRFLAEHDALTGVRNRRRFELDVNEQVARAKRYGEHASLLLIDANRFKRINDTYGHGIGDRALQVIAETLTHRMRHTDTVARIGGDEFAVLLPYADAVQADAVATDLRRAISECIVDVADRPRLRLSVSIGLVEINQSTSSDEAILAEADAAMYADKTGAQLDD